MNKALDFLLLIFAFFLSNVECSEFYCTRSNNAYKYETGKSACFGCYIFDRNGHRFIDYLNSLPTNCSDVKTVNQQLERCYQGFHLGCCDSGGPFCLDKVTPSDNMKGKSSESYTCSLDYPRIHKPLFTQPYLCMALFDGNTTGLKISGVDTSPHNLTGVCPATSASAGGVLAASESCPVGKYYKCCSDKKVNCVANLTSDGALPCRSSYAFVCSEKDTNADSFKGQRVCMAVYDSKNKDEKPSLVMSTSGKTCADASHSFGCEPGKFYACCDDSTPFCVDKKLKAEDAKSCPSISCSSTTPSLEMSPTHSVCVAVFDKNVVGTKAKLSFKTYKSCWDIKSYLDIICAGQYYICCDTTNCLDDAKAEKAEKCPAVSKFPCSVVDATKIMEKYVSVCFAVFDKKEKGVKGKFSVQPYSSCTKAKDDLKSICGDKFFTCCDTIHCLDSAKAENSDQCPTSTIKFACSSTDTKIVMEKGKSVCFSVFNDNVAGSNGTLSVKKYASCADAKKNLMSICVDKFYVCCEKANCLDSARAVDSKACGSKSKDIVCLDSSPDLVLKGGEGVCLLIKRPQDILPSQKTSKMRDCLSARGIYCSPGFSYHCCSTNNCLSEAASKLEMCSGSSPSICVSKFLLLLTVLILFSKNPICQK